MLAMACWVGLCCASKDFSDVAGDRLAGRHTWPVMFGPARAARLLAVVAVSCGLAALVGSIVGRVSIVPACVVLAGSVLLAGTAVVSAAVSDRAVRRRPYRVFLATQYAVNVAFILAAVVG
jgi:4-hydroxybenzoate polyprenyltransferase